jgi:prepilin peptidase CpaA
MGGGAWGFRDLSRNKMNAQMWIAVLVGLAATANDLARREVSNWIPVAAIAAGFGWHIGRGGWMGAWQALMGTLAGFAAFLVFYLLGGMGGGDIKLMAGFGALLGPGLLLPAALWTAAIGGVIAAGVLGWRAVRRWAAPAGSPRKRDAKQTDATSESIPYAPAITLGVWIALAVGRL